MKKIVLITSVLNVGALVYLYLQVWQLRQEIAHLKGQPRSALHKTVVVKGAKGLKNLQSKVDSLASESRTVRQKVDQLETIKTDLSQPKSVEKVNSSKRKIFFLRLKVNKYYKLHNRYPATVPEVLAAVEDVPSEDISGSARISLTKDFKGGWFYNSRTGMFSQNIK